VDRDWFRRLYRGTGLAFHEGRLVLSLNRPHPWDEPPADLAFSRYGPVWGPGGELAAVGRDWVAVAGRPGGAWQVVRGPFGPG
jgi:hypothetical protein